MAECPVNLSSGPLILEAFANEFGGYLPTFTIVICMKLDISNTHTDRRLQCSDATQKKDLGLIESSHGADPTAPRVPMLGGPQEEGKDDYNGSSVTSV